MGGRRRGKKKEKMDKKVEDGGGWKERKILEQVGGAEEKKVKIAAVGDKEVGKARASSQMQLHFQCYLYILYANCELYHRTQAQL